MKEIYSGSETHDLKTICHNHLEWSKLLKEKTTPMLTNFDYIPLMYEWFKEFMPANGIDDLQIGHMSNSERKNMFIIISISLYSPAVIIGHPLVRGLRGKLAEIFGIDDTAISKRYSQAICNYQNYKDTRECTNSLYQAIRERLVEEGILPPPANP